MSINRGWRYSRIEHNPREKAFADQWEKENVPIRGMNYGHGILQDLFFCGDPYWNPMRMRRCTKRISNRERMIVATIVQWLGSNIGWAFLQDALKQCGYEIVKRNVKKPTTHTETICCPHCGVVQVATVLHTQPFNSMVHECDKCGWIIGESEWERVPAIRRGKPTMVRCRWCG